MLAVDGTHDQPKACMMHVAEFLSKTKTSIDGNSTGEMHVHSQATSWTQLTERVRWLPS